jgi:uncharacterized protein
MKLAVNYSPQSSQLYRDGLIKLDLFKCPDWPDLVDAALKENSTYVHFSLATLSTSLAEAKWQEIAHFLELTGTQNINLHLLSEPALDPTNSAQTRAEIQKIIDMIKRVIDRFSPDQVILENTPMARTGREYMRPIVDPQTISEIIEQSGCRLLLDLSHALISAVTLGMEASSYIQNLPVNRLAEVHITGTVLENGQLVDHRAMQDGDWPLLEWALTQIRSRSWAEPNIVAFEYSGFGHIFQPYSDPAVLEAQVPQLFRLIHPEHND